MRQTPVNDYLEEISTRLPEEIYGYLSDAIYETVCEFDEEVAQLKAENAKLRERENNLFNAVIAKSNELLGLFCENEKLRELVRDWYELAVGGADSLTDWNHAQAELEHRMRELGVKAD